MFQGSMPQLMAAYNQWQNQQLYDAAFQISDAQRKADCGAFFKSIHSTLNHILWGDLTWLSARMALDARLIDWANGLSVEWLDEPVTWSSAMYGFTQTIPRWIQVQQMFNHQTHHRGQVGTLLKQYGIDVGLTDLPLLLMLND